MNWSVTCLSELLGWGRPSQELHKTTQKAIYAPLLAAPEEPDAHLHNRRSNNLQTNKISADAVKVKGKKRVKEAEKQK
jgi:hypothetical protein